jgi:hypothetical protein
MQELADEFGAEQIGYRRQAGHAVDDAIISFCLLRMFGNGLSFFLMI